MFTYFRPQGRYCLHTLIPRVRSMSFKRPAAIQTPSPRRGTCQNRCWSASRAARRAPHFVRGLQVKWAIQTWLFRSNRGPHFLGVLKKDLYYFGAYVRALDFWKLPHGLAQHGKDGKTSTSLGPNRKISP